MPDYLIASNDMKPPKSFKPALTLETLKKGNVKASDAFKTQIALDELKRHVRYLRGLSLKHVDFDYLKSCLMPILHCYFHVSPSAEIGQFIYRAVPWAAKPTNKEQLGYPPASRVGEFGRANRPHAPLFYGSVGCHSTIVELAPNLGDRLAISKWRVQKSLNVACVGYTEKTFRGKAGISRWSEITWAKQHAEDHMARTPQNQLVHEFLAREFTKKVPKGKAWQYKMSAAICELLLKAHSFGLNGAPAIEIAGILYPSTPNEANADNLALRHSIADTRLEFVSVQYIEIFQKTNHPQYSMRGLDFADGLSATGEIQWKSTFPSNLIAGTDHRVDIEDGNFVIRDNKDAVVGQLA